MKRSFHALVAGLLGLAACHTQTKQPAATKAPTPTSAAPTPTHEANAPGTAYQTYRALLPGQADSITLHLVAAPASAQGAAVDGSDGGAASYTGTYYTATGAPQAVSGRAGSLAADSLLLDEYPRAAAMGNEAPAPVAWRLRRLATGELAGTRAGAPLRLRPARLPGSVAFSQHALADSVAALPGRAKSPYGHLSWQALLPATGAAAPRAALTAGILRELRGDTLDAGPAPASLDAAWQQARASFSGSYREDVRALLGDEPLDSLPRYSLRYTSDQATQVLCNEQHLLSLGFFSASYSGGAHGSYATTVASFDLRTGRRLRFADIFLPPAQTQLGPLLSRAAHQTLGLKPNEPLDQALNVRQLPVTHNVYLAPGGVVFVYVPYEIASYAQGEIEVFVPYAELRPLLREGLPLVGGRAVAATAAGLHLCFSTLYLN